MKVGILTGGGDCPGLNGVIRAVVRKIANAGGTTVGLLEGWRGLIEGHERPLTPLDTCDILSQGGTILGSSRTNPFKRPEDLSRAVENFRKLGLDALVAIGGDDTLSVASRLYSEKNLPTVGVPKTIDNDLSATDCTFGFDTALNIVCEAVDRIRTTAESHKRIMVVETMGRHAGWIACFSGIAVGADYIFVPEMPIDLEHLYAVLQRRRGEGKRYGIVIVSEGAELPDKGMVAEAAPDRDDFGHVKLGGIAEILANLIEKKTGFETRHVVLGHTQRGGNPSALDRILSTRFGLKAAELVIAGQFGQMAALHGTHVVSVPLKDAVAANKKLDLHYYELAKEFFKDSAP